MMQDVSSHKMAELLRTKGLNVYSIPSGKKEAVSSWKKYQTEKYTGSIPEGSNYCIIAGQTSENLVIIDIDKTQDESIIDKILSNAKNKTLVVKSGGDGLHLYLKCARLPKTLRLDNKDGVHIDVQSQGTYVIGPGSIHPNGKRYEVISETLNILTVDFENVIEALQKLGFKVERQKGSEIAKGGIPEGSRHGAAITYANHLAFRVGIDLKTLKFEMERWNQTNESPLPSSELEQIVKDSWNNYQNNKPIEENKVVVTIEDNEDVLGETTGLQSKTIKGDENYIQRILFNGLSSFTENPSHLMVMEKTSEGKTYPVLEIAQHFPKDNVIILASATPQTFKYEYGVLVDKNYKPIQDKVDELDKQIEESKTNKKPTSDLEKQKRDIMKYSKTLIELKHKWIIFKEPPDPKLFEALFSTLSSDEEYSEHKFVNKTSAGKQQNFTVVLHGTPAMLACSARDETKNKRWAETASRFEITSPISSPEKYKGGMNIIGLKQGMPSHIYKKHVISDEDKEQIKKNILKLIHLIKQTNGELVNPFTDELNRLFPQEVGTRWRQYKRFQTLMNLHCFCYGHQRPQLESEGKYYPVVTKDDLLWANKIMEDNQIIAPNKLRWFNDVFIPLYKENNCLPLKVGEVVDFVNNKGGKTNYKQVREVFLEPLEENGFIDSDEDPNHKNHLVYWTNHKEGSVLGSPITLSNVMALSNPSCVNSCLTKYFGQRFRSVQGGKSLTPEQLVSLITTDQNVIESAKNEPKKSDNVITFDNVLERARTENSNPLFEAKRFFICETCDPPAGPFEKNEESKSSGNILEFHEKLGHKIMWMDDLEQRESK